MTNEKAAISTHTYLEGVKAKIERIASHNEEIMQLENTNLETISNKEVAKETLIVLEEMDSLTDLIRVMANDTAIIKSQMKDIHDLAHNSGKTIKTIDSMGRKIDSHMNKKIVSAFGLLDEKQNKSSDYLHDLESKIEDRLLALGAPLYNYTQNTTDQLNKIVKQNRIESSVEHEFRMIEIEKQNAKMDDVISAKHIAIKRVLIISTFASTAGLIIGSLFF